MKKINFYTIGFFLYQTHVALSNLEKRFQKLKRSFEGINYPRTSRTPTFPSYED
ncbi:hypothetical protein LBBP_02592 [Leptospira borgpetersenii serovar Ballum]|uniref:Uncharacterized protein n=1 Tax=Leptospira borgpetersenii serovar Ballum TaxID=280505 RepID=A0A0S2ITI6_LEPBO|nr:hypothetical protein LBBP_02592 [Leptospira borgpetersenii serovar Ballum]